MTETPGQKEDRLKAAKELFSELLKKKDEYPPQVRQELEADLNNCKKRLRGLQVTHYIWTNHYTMKEATEAEVENYRNTSTLFVDDDNELVYFKDKLITEIENAPVKYGILKCLLKNRGSVTAKQIAESVKPERQYKKKSTIKEKLGSSISRLRSDLNEYGLVLKSFRSVSLSLDESIDFVLSKRK